MNDTSSVHILDLDTHTQNSPDPGIIVYVPDQQFDYSFWDSVASSGFDVFIVESEQEVIQLLEHRKFETLYIHTDDKNEYSALGYRLKTSYNLQSVIYFSSIKELLLTKSEPKKLPHIGTFGTLADMNLIDLLQIMNGRGKACMISITSACHQLTIYTHDGIVLYASNNDVYGEKAIFDAFTWKDGIWNLDPIDFLNLPEANMEKSIDAILLEGCKYMDESLRIDTSREFNSDDPLNFFEE